MTVAAAVCFALAAIAELWGISLLVYEAKAANGVLVQYLRRTEPLESPVLEHYRRLDAGSAHDRQDADEMAVQHLLSSKANARLAVILLIAGVLTGALGNFLSLSW